MAHIEKRKTKNGEIRYKAQVRVKGVPIQTKTFIRKTDAERWAKQVEISILEGRFFNTAESKKHTVKDLIERYERDVLPRKPRAKQEQHFQWWKERLGKYFLNELTPALIVQCRDELASGTTVRHKIRSPATVNRYLSSLSHALSVATKEWQWMDSNPMLRVSKYRESQGRIRFLSDDERTRLLQACKESTNPLLYPAVFLSILTGMRQSELMNLEWNIVDFERKTLTLHHTKNYDRRLISLPTPALELLIKLHEKKDLNNPFVFGVWKTSKGKRGYFPVDLRKAWNNALKRAEIKDMVWHDLRHTFASYLAQSGASLIELAYALGHKGLSMVKRYSHISENHTAKIVERMSERLTGSI